LTDLLFVWLPVIAAAAALSFGAFLIAIGFRATVRSALLSRRGLRGVAAVANLYCERVTVRSDERRAGQSTRYHHYLDYTLEIDGRIWPRDRVLVSKSLWKTLAVGDPVEVLYLAEDPAQSALAGTSATIGLAGGTIQMIVGGMLTAAALAFFGQGIAGALSGTPPPAVGRDWIEDKARIVWISVSDDPFVRLLRPDHRLVKIQIGREGREIPGEREVLMPHADWSGLRVHDVVPVLRDPNDRNRAVLESERR